MPSMLTIVKKSNLLGSVETKRSRACTVMRCSIVRIYIRAILIAKHYNIILLVYVHDPGNRETKFRHAVAPQVFIFLYRYPKAVAAPWVEDIPVGGKLHRAPAGRCA